MLFSVKITGFRKLTTLQDWGRPVGDVNGFITDGITEVPIVVVETDGGIEGIGLGSHADLDRIFPAIYGQDPRATTTLYDQMLRYVFKSGHCGATFGGIGAFDMALWDIKAKMAGEPLWRTLGASDRYVPGYASALEVAIPDEELPGLLQAWVDRGFTSVKLKGGLDVASDLRRLGIARNAFSANTPRPGLMLDANESWRRKQAVRHVYELEREFDLTWIEEPLRRWDAEGLAMLNRSIRAGIATGENLTGLEQLRPLLASEAVDIVQVGTMWGVSNFLRTAVVAHAHDLPISPVGSLCSPVWHAAAAVPNHLGLEIQSLTNPFGLSTDHTICDGGVVLGDQPGNGLAVDEAALSVAQADAAWHRPAGPHVRPAIAGLRLIPEAMPPRPAPENRR